MNDNKRFSIDLNYNLIQSIRLIHSIYEVNDNLTINRIHKKKFKLIKNNFNVNLKYVDNLERDISSHIEYSHKIPFIKIGNIKRTLIFPHGIINNLKGRWSEEKYYDYSFIGLFNSSRKEIINKWLDETFKAINFQKLHIDSLKTKWLNNLFSKKENKYHPRIHILSSKKGRRYPKKSWDNNYYDVLLKSKFVLCPPGDFDWSYRFFEAILCGAVPIVENNCDAYDGFKFYFFKNKLDELIYDQEIINHNFNLCLKKITISNEILKREIRDILNEK